PARRTGHELPTRYAVPPHVPVRTAVGSGDGGPGDPHRPQVPPRPRPRVLAVRVLLHRGPRLDRDPADRRGRTRARPAAERMDLDPGLPGVTGDLPGTDEEVSRAGALSMAARPGARR